jgi:hypothetical protein
VHFPNTFFSISYPFNDVNYYFSSKLTVAKLVAMQNTALRSQNPFPLHAATYSLNNSSSHVLYLTTSNLRRTPYTFVPR